MSENQMPNIDHIKHKLTDVDLHYIKRMEAKNLAKSTKIKIMQKKNRIIGGFFALTAIGVYAYTIANFKQEKFDDFEDVRTT